MIIRKYRPEDCAATARLFYDTVHTVNAADYTQAQLDVWATGTVDSDRWNASFLSHDTVVAEENGEILGFGDMDETGYLDRLYVHRDYQRRGIATVICDELEGAVLGKITTHASVTAKPFFENRGYRVVRAQQVERQGVLLTNFVMEKENIPTGEELTEAKRQISSTIRKLRETVKTLEGKENPARLKSQITLAKRRVKAYTVALRLIEKELEKSAL